MADVRRSANFELVTGFAVPFAQVRCGEPQKMNADLRALFLGREAEGDRYRNVTATMDIPNGLFESRFDLFRWEEPCVRALRDFCMSALYKAVGDLCEFDAPTLTGLDVRADSWFHITRKGGYFGAHNHPMASWSGVYCVDDGREQPRHPESGSLVFLNPNAAATGFTDVTTVGVKSPWGLGPRTYQLEPGELIIFPSWLMHYVTPFLGEGERITVAFNAWFRQKATA